MIKTIYDHYGVKPAELIDVYHYKGFQYRNVLYIIMDVGYLEPEEMYEFHQMSQFLIAQGERQVASFMINKSGNIITEEDGKKIAVFRVPYQHRTPVVSYGGELAAFHQRGKLLPYPMEKSNRIGQWKALWEKRLEQIEKFWGMKVQEHPNDVTDKRFIESFPYYLGLTENAIQYLADTEIDDLPRAFDTATICHHRFTSVTWQHPFFFKLPTDWVFDHPSRDLAEYIRHQYFESSVWEERRLYTFLSEYEKIAPLSSFAWRLLYARLLFPVHYFESIEGYYSTRNEEEKQKYARKIEKTITESVEYEQFLSNLYRSVGISTQRHHIPEIEWFK
ncbi:spore coat putative kinase YutH [Bacillus songklensis]|uniref:Spore coat putative kinase YutH n=1 Tax=Bacillus songklensis TaxID=1069116 RepID=A0ABV8BC86_9BACI